jgi:hypothetical protein
MTANETRARFTAGLKLHGQAGLLIIFLAEALLFSGNQVVGRWFTPIVWTGYILFVDALVYKLKGESLLVTNRAEFLIIAVISIASWWIFEFYNAPRFWRTFLNCDTNASLLFARTRGHAHFDVSNSHQCMKTKRS